MQKSSVDRTGQYAQTDLDTLRKTVYREHWIAYWVAVTTQQIVSHALKAAREG